VPFAMLAPQAHVTLIESNQKKATFLRELIFQLDLKNAQVFADRGEKYVQTADVVTMRAVESFGMAFPLAMKLTEPKGRIALMVGSSQVQEAISLVNKIEWNEPVPVPGGHSRVLLVGTKAVQVE
jgi:16S rRNA (guanine527-N7)-methyltransferase